MLKQPKKLAQRELLDYAVKSLGARAQSTGELRSRLLRRALEPADVDEVLGRMREYGYLDDKRFAESFAAARLQNQGFGQTRTLRDLRARRVSPVAAESAVRKTYAETDEVALIEEYIRRKYRSADRSTLFQEDKDLASAYRRLLRAGFKSSAVVQVLKRFAKNPELLDGMEDAEADES